MILVAYFSIDMVRTTPKQPEKTRWCPKVTALQELEDFCYGLRTLYFSEIATSTYVIGGTDHKRILVSGFSIDMVRPTPKQPDKTRWCPQVTALQDLRALADFLRTLYVAKSQF